MLNTALLLTSDNDVSLREGLENIVPATPTKTTEEKDARNVGSRTDKVVL
jgi:hypothetical protein